MTIVVDQISSFKVFGEEISQSLLEFVPSSLIKKATSEINQALKSKPIQETLKNKKVTRLNYEILPDEILVHIGGIVLKAKIRSDPFHKIYEYLTRINKTKSHPLLSEVDQVQPHPEDEEADSNLSSGSNVLTMVRNGLSMDPAIGPYHTLVTSLGSLSGIFSVILGIRLMNYANRMRNTSQEIEDTDGVRRSTLLCLNAGGISSLGASFFTEKMYQTLVNSQGGTFLGKLIIPLYIAVSALSVFFESYRLYKADHFKTEFNLYYQNKDLTEKDKIKATLAFLKDSIQPTPLEKYKIERQAEIYCQNPQDLQSEIARKIDQLVQRKKSLLERNINADCMDRLRQLDFERLNAEDDVALRRAKKLCQDMIDVHSKKVLYFRIKLVAATVSLTAAILFAVSPIIAIPASLVILSCLMHLATNHQKTFDLAVECILGIQNSIQNSLFSENGIAAI